MAAKTFVVARHSVGQPLLVPGVTVPTWAPVPYAPSAYGPGWGTPPPMAAPMAPPAPTSDGPHWDEARDTYIHYDRGTEHWLHWDEAARQWRPIDS